MLKAIKTKQPKLTPYSFPGSSRYRCIPWGPISNIGGDAQGPTNTWSRLDDNHKITLPEVKWLAKQIVDMPGAAGILITDDGVPTGHINFTQILQFTPILPLSFLTYFVARSR